MKVVWKFPLAISNTVEIPMPVGAEILHVDVQDPGQVATVLALCDADAVFETRTLKVRGTGHCVEPGLRHVATFQQGPLVWHVFEDTLTH